MTKRAVFIGRFQPFHKGHEWLFRQKLDKGIPILIMIRDIAPDEKNPFTPEEARDMIYTGLAGDDMDRGFIEIIIIPDIESVNWGRGVGYEVNEHVPPEDIGRVSATDIRAGITSGNDDWKKMVRPNVAIWLEDYYKDKR